MLVFKEPLFYLIPAPKRKSSDAGNPHLPNRSLKGVCMYRNTHSTHMVLSMVMGTHWESWNGFPVDTGDTFPP